MRTEAIAALIEKLKNCRLEHEISLRAMEHGEPCGALVGHRDCLLAIPRAHLTVLDFVIEELEGLEEIEKCASEQWIN